MLGEWVALCRSLGRQARAMWRPGGQIGGQEDSVDSRRIDWRLEEQCGGQKDKLETKRAVERRGGSEEAREQIGGQEDSVDSRRTD